jgi:hypothetical protein
MHGWSFFGMHPIIGSTEAWIYILDFLAVNTSLYSQWFFTLFIFYHDRWAIRLLKTWDINLFKLALVTMKFLFILFQNRLVDATFFLVDHILFSDLPASLRYAIRHWPNGRLIFVVHDLYRHRSSAHRPHYVFILRVVAAAGGLFIFSNHFFLSCWMRIFFRSFFS